MRITVPHMGLLSIAYTRVLREHGVDMLPPPKPSLKTLNLGVMHSPEFACLPFKINLGNMIESLEAGADTIVMPGGYGPCRFGYYGVVQEQILRDLGYNFSMITTDNPDRLSDMIKTIRDISNIKKKFDGYKVFYLILMRMAVLDRAVALYHYYKPRELNHLEAERAREESIRIIEEATSFRSLFSAFLKIKALFKDVRIVKKFRPIRVGILGEIFVTIEPLANMNIERKLGEMHVEVVRGVWLSDWLNDRFRFKPFKKNQDKLSRKWAKGYLDYPSGGESIETVGKTVRFLKNGIDGVIHIMPFTCMPELVASAILHRISKDSNFPVLSLSFDENVSEVNLITRLEAFIDLLESRKSGRLLRH